MTRPDEEALDEALARRLPDEEPFSRRATRMRQAQRPADILREAQGLSELIEKTSAHKT